MSPGTAPTLGIDCGPDCSAAFDAGTVVTLWAIPFLGDRSSRVGRAPVAAEASVLVTLDQARTVTARFDSPGPTDIKSTFTVSRNGTGTGTVKSGPPGINCGSDCGMRYPANVNMTLTATAAAGSHVAGWSGACAGAGTAAKCVVTVGPSTGVTVTFDLDKSAAPPAPAPPAPSPPSPPPPPPAQPLPPPDPPKAPAAEVQEPPKSQEPAPPAPKTLTAGSPELQVFRAARRLIRLELTLRSEADCRLRVLRRGRVVLVRRVKAHAGENVLSLPASRLRQGHYRFEVVLADGAGRVQRLTWPVRL